MKKKRERSKAGPARIAEGWTPEGTTRAVVYRESQDAKTWRMNYQIVDDFPIALVFYRAGKQIGKAFPFDRGEGLLWEAVVFCGSNTVTYGCDSNLEIIKAAVEAWGE